MKISIIVFACVFFYRLLRYVFCWLRTQLYLDALKEKNQIPLEVQPAITKLIYKANTYDIRDDLSALRKAKGVFCLRIRENLSLFFWIETIFFLPSRLFDYFGMKTRVKKHTFGEYFLSALGWCICFIIGLFSDEIKSVLLSLF